MPRSRARPHASSPGKAPQAEAPAPTALSVRLDRPALRLGEVEVPLTGRWDAAFMLELLRAKAQPGTASGAAVDAQRMTQALTAHGLTGVLAGTQVARILHRLQQALQALDTTGALAQCLAYPVRGRTTGPWWWQGAVSTRQEDEPAVGRAPAQVAATLPDSPAEAAWPVRSPLALTHAMAVIGLGLAADEEDTTALRLLGRLKLGLEAAWKADQQHALDLLDDGPAWQGESDGLACLRLLRLAELLRGMGRHDESRSALQRLGCLARHPQLRELFAPHWRLAWQRVDYAQDPVTHYARLRVELGRSAPGGVLPAQVPAAPEPEPVGMRLAGVDATALAEHLHLLALCERRHLEHRSTWNGSRAERRARLLPLLRAAHGAILLFLLARNQDRTQHVCANLAYAHQKLAPALGEPHWTLAVRWHELSFGLHASFGGAESSAWEYIYLGELWLDSPQAREACRQPGVGGTWDDDVPGEPAFYERACRVAEQLGDPRQLAYTWLNRYRHAQHLRMPALRRSSAARLNRLFKAHPEVRQVLVQEGYQLPRAIGD